MKKFLTALISAGLLAMPLALVSTPVSAKTSAQAQDGQTGAKAKSKSKKGTTKKKAKKQKSAAVKPAP